jgi:hypothetical protein
MSTEPSPRELPSTAAAAWAEWAQDFGEHPANPKRSSWAALRESFYGGMIIASAMLCKGPPQDLDTVRTRYFELRSELEAWIDSNEVNVSAAGYEPVTQEWIDELAQWLRKQSTDDKVIHMVWSALDEDEEGYKSLPELGFAPQLGTTIAALQAIAGCTFPRHDDPSGEEKSVPLSTELRTIAAVTLHRLFGNDEDEDEDTWRLPSP